MAKRLSPAITETLKELESAFNEWENLQVTTKRSSTRKVSSAKPRRIFAKLKKQINELSK
jgi:hypothetical protein